MTGRAGKLSIGLARFGCANRPFYHIAVLRRKVISKAPVAERVIEQVGSYDPLQNKHDETMVAINYERLRYWIAQNARPSKQVAQLLGLAGFFPLHPMTIIQAKRNRTKAAAQQAEAAARAEAVAQAEAEAQRETVTRTDTSVESTDTDKDTSPSQS